MRKHNPTSTLYTREFQVSDALLHTSGVGGAILKTGLISVLPHEVVYASLVEWTSLPHEERTFGLVISGIDVSWTGLALMRLLLSQLFPHRIQSKQLSRRLELRLAVLDVSKERGPRSVIKRYAPAFAAFTFPDPHQSLALRYLDILQPEIGKLGYPEASAE
jgi:hypothetical protein